MTTTSDEEARHRRRRELANLTVDDAMTALVQAPCIEEARDIARMLPTRTLRGLCDLMYVDPPSSTPKLVELVVTEARA